MNEAELLCRIIDSHEGETNAITAGEMARQLGMMGKNDDRKVRTLIENLIFINFKPILASTGDPPGYFKPVTWTEWQRYDQVIKERIKEICKRKAQVKKNVYDYFYGNVRVRLI